MNIRDTEISDLKVFFPQVYQDNRGYFFEAYNYKYFLDIGIPDAFVQDNQSCSVKGVLRGMHIQENYPQAKIVRVIRGSIWDVAVDMRPNSQTFGKWFGIELSSDNKEQLLIPANFAHGFLTLSEEAEILMKVTTHYHHGDEIGFMWDDETIGIEWPLQKVPKLILADKDTKWKSFKEAFSL